MDWTHQDLRGMRPAEVRSGLKAETLQYPETEYWFSGWGGVLDGYYLRR